MTNVRAAVTERPGQIAVRSFPMPDPGPGAIIMKVRLSGICGTDKHTFRGESKQYAGTPHERNLTYPLICGHENVGEVVALGGEVLDSEGRKLKIGDRIVPGANVACGRCHFCLNGFPYYFCKSLNDYGNSLHCGTPPHLFGGWAEHMYLLPRSKLFRVPDALPDRVAVLTEIMGVTHGIEKAMAVLGLFGGISFGGTVAVLGVGPLGLCHVIKARLLGAATIIVSDPFGSRLEAAGRFGADHLLNVAETSIDDRIARVRELSGGYGADIVVSASGVTATFTEALKMVRMGGVVIEAGAFVDMGPVSVNPNADFCSKNVTVIGIGGETSETYLPSMRLLAANLKRYPLEDLVSHAMALDEAQDAVELAQTAAAIKVVIAPNGPATA